MPETSEYTRLGDGNQSLFGRWQYLTRLEKGLILITTVFGIVIFSLAVALAKCDAQVPPTPSPNVTTVAPETTTAPYSTTVEPTTSTVAPGSTSVAPASSKIPPASSTVAPVSTSVAPSSTSVAPSSTLVAPSSTSVAPSSTSVAPSSTLEVPASTSEVPASSTIVSSSILPIKRESPPAANVKQLDLESTMSSKAPFSENVTKLLKNIPPIPVTGIKLISPEKDEATTNLPGIEETRNNIVTSEASAQIYSEVPENNTEKDKRSSDLVLSRQKRIDVSLIAESKKDNPIYE